jgi:superfamily II helicase
MAWDVNDPQDRTILETARSWGVSPSTFMGTSTTHQVTELGGSTVKYIETPGWTEEDRKAALELAVYESELCPGCGHPMSETMAPENEFQYKADLPFRCHRCTTTELAMERYQEHPAASALYMPVKLIKREETHDDSSRDEVE